MEIPPDQVEAVTLFFSLATQWREGFSGRIGLDYAAIRPTAEMAGIELTPDLFRDLRAMETEALKVWSEKRT
ncbi:MAG: hypothetical protein DCC73_11980 [Proteobacteria bacterium]|nr:MAG: hypothetical protein DCC73_11980 [Pseudomonadota bacterium]